MKLAAFALVTTLGLGGAAHADPVRADGRARGQLHELVLERFDANRDGRLESAERRRAIRALRRLTHRLAMRELRDGDRGRRGRAIRRFDHDAEGAITPAELSPALRRDDE